MRITCPLCGPRDRREFACAGPAGLFARPAPDAPPEVWDDYLHLRDNPAGPTAEAWQHATGCAAWLIVERDTLTHEVFSARLATADEEAAG